MEWYYYIAWFLIATQFFVVWFFSRNLRYAISNPWKDNKDYQPKSLLTIPCKGLDLTFEDNIVSFLKQDYPDFIINFVVESEQDPAYQKLLELKEKYQNDSSAKSINVLVAGITSKCSQKIHNLLYSYDHCPKDIEALLFADSDACAGKDWIRHLVAPLKRKKTGVSTGYRWFIPRKNNISTVIMSVSNAKVAQFLGKYKFNQAWGGSMAISKEKFEEFKVPQVWSNVVSDDLSISYLARKANKKIVFVPSCMVASYEETTFPKLFEFSRRQFIISRVYMPWIWTFGLLSSIYTVTCFWGSIVLAVIALRNNVPNTTLYMTVPAVFVLAHWTKSVFRSITAMKLLPQEVSKLKIAMIADFIFSPFYSIGLLVSIVSASFGRVITWRGIRYKLVSPEKTEILDRKK